MTKTPKEKANELVQLFTFHCKECDNAILSAQFAVNEILKIIEDNCLEYEDDYWVQVKKEIELLCKQ